MSFNPLKLLSIPNKKKEAEGIIQSVGSVVDNLVTSDKERKELQVSLERLSALNKSTFVAGGRSAMMYALGVILIYQSVVRDWLAIKYGVDQLPDAAIDVADLAVNVVKLLAGVM